MRKHDPQIPLGDIATAAQWLATTPRDKRGHAVPELKRRFALTPAQSVEAIRQADLIKARAT